MRSLSLQTNCPVQLMQYQHAELQPEMGVAAQHVSSCICFGRCMHGHMQLLSTHTSVKAYAAADVLCSDTLLWLQLSVNATGVSSRPAEACLYLQVGMSRLMTSTSSRPRCGVYMTSPMSSPPSTSSPRCTSHPPAGLPLSGWALRGLPYSNRPLHSSQLPPCLPPLLQPRLATARPLPPQQQAAAYKTTPTSGTSPAAP